MVLDKRSRNVVRQKFSKMTSQVVLHYLHNDDKDECPYCEVTKDFLEEISELSGGKVIVRVYKASSNAYKIFGVKGAPVIMFDGYKIRYLGAPFGQETWAFLDTIVMASNKNSKLSDVNRQYLSKLNRDVHIETIVTPTCPYCPYAALLANSAAIVSSRVISDIVESFEFPEIGEKYGVTAVPTIAINGEVAFVGVPPEDKFIQSIVEGKTLSSGSGHP